MKIAVPVNGQDIKSGVSDSFGRAPNFLIYDTKSKEEVYIENGAVASQGGAGIRAAQIIVDQDIDALLTPRCGQNAADVLEQAKVKLYQTTGESIQENIDAFLGDTLALLDKPHPGLNKRGGN